MPSAVAYRAAEFFAGAVPDVPARAAVRLGSRIAATTSGDRKRLVKRNLERALGRPVNKAEARRHTARVFEWYGRYYFESFCLPQLSASDVDRGFAYEGVETLERAVRSGVGPILVMPHLGCWEWAAWWLAQVPKMNVTAVVERLEPPEVFDWFMSFRQRLGMEIIPVGSKAGALLAAAVKRGNVVCLLSDRDVGGTGIVTTFFREKTRLPAGPALLALRTGAPLIPAAVYWRGSARHAIALPPLDTRRRGRIRDDMSRVVADYAAALEGLIRRAPEQWHLMSPNWPSDYEAIGQPTPPHLQNI